MAMTQKFTAEEVRREAAGLKAHGYLAGPAMLNAYAEELRAALAAQGQGEPDPMEAIVQHCMVTEAVSPDSADPYGTISRVIDWHQANTAPPATRMVELEAQNARLRKDADDDRKGYGKLLSAFHKSKTRLATANALLRECVHFIDYGGAADDELAEKIAAHLSENGHE